jgi:hypothetical protein
VNPASIMIATASVAAVAFGAAATAPPADPSPTDREVHDLAVTSFSEFLGATSPAETTMSSAHCSVDAQHVEAICEALVDGDRVVYISVLSPDAVTFGPWLTPEESAARVPGGEAAAAGQRADRVAGLDLGTAISDAVVTCIREGELTELDLELLDQGHSVLMSSYGATDAFQCIRSALGMPEWIGEMIAATSSPSGVTTVELSSGLTVRWSQGPDAVAAVVVHDAEAV